jgi:hypothetical protein
LRPFRFRLQPTCEEGKAKKKHREPGIQNNWEAGLFFEKAGADMKKNISLLSFVFLLSLASAI